MEEYGYIYLGKEMFSESWINVVNPYTGEITGRVAAISGQQVNKIIAELITKKVHLPRYKRNSILNGMADSLENRIEEMAERITKESGLCLKDTVYEVKRAIDVLRFSAIQALLSEEKMFPCDVTPTGKNRRIYTQQQPLNLVAAITPFNHPLNQVVHKIAPAIAAGAKVILKPSSKTPLTAMMICRIALENNLPPEMITVLHGEDREVSKTLVEDSNTELISFTGSSQVGKWIGSNAGYKRLLLELGGSSVLMILPDANLEQAVRIAKEGTFKNSGQRCTAIRRILVHHSMADSFAARLAEEAASLVYGDPLNPESEMGTVIDENSAILIESRIEDAIKNGAKLLTGFKRKGALLAPTVLDHVKNDFELVANETFGPVAPIIRFNNLDEGLSIANDTCYGLSGAVVSDHWPSIQRVISELETGTVNVNEVPGYRLEWSPFGGIKDSGLGYKEGVIEAIKAMSWVKTYSLPWDTP